MSKTIEDCIKWNWQFGGSMEAYLDVLVNGCNVRCTRFRICKAFYFTKHWEYTLLLNTFVLSMREMMCHAESYYQTGSAGDLFFCLLNIIWLPNFLIVIGGNGN